MNQQQNNQIFQQPYVQKNAAYYRARAKAVLQKNYWMAFLALFLAMLLGGTAYAQLSFSVDINISDKTIDASNYLQEFVRIVVDTLRAIHWVKVISAMLFQALFVLLVGSAVKLGFQKFHLDLVDGKPARIETLFDYFKLAYGKSVMTNLLYSLIMTVSSLPVYIGGAVLALAAKSAAISILNGVHLAGAVGILMLCLCLFALISVATAVLQIWLSYRYYFTFMILAEYPEMRALDALRSSATLMRGNKWNLFCLQISYIGWLLLGALCCGVGVFFVIPYMNAANACFYDDIAKRNASHDVEFPSLDPNDYNPDMDPNRSQ